MSSPLDFATPRLPEGALPSWSLRRGRVTPRQQDALLRLWPRWGVAVDGMPLDPQALFGRDAPLLLEVGSGMGEATAATAAQHPEQDVLAVDVHTPGLGALLAAAEQGGLANVRVAEGDARVLLGMLPEGVLSQVRVLFPDPWPKNRHAGRRLVDDDFAALAASRLAPGGVLHVATDWASCAEAVRGVLARCPLLVPAPPPHRPPTRFEARGRAAGRAVHDLAARRVRPEA